MSLFKKLCLVIITLSSSVTAIALLPIAYESYNFITCYEDALTPSERGYPPETHMEIVNFCNGGHWYAIKSDLGYK